MKFKKLVFALTFTLFALTGMMAANENNPCVTNKYKSVEQLNNAMTVKLGLMDSQKATVFELNRQFWLSRKNIMNRPDMIGQNTALLACWDKWRIALAEKLTKPQMEKFMQWQSQVDLLGDTPF